MRFHCLTSQMNDIKKTMCSQQHLTDIATIHTSDACQVLLFPTTEKQTGNSSMSTRMLILAHEQKETNI